MFLDSLRYRIVQGIVHLSFFTTTSADKLLFECGYYGVRCNDFSSPIRLKAITEKMQ